MKLLQYFALILLTSSCIAQPVTDDHSLTPDCTTITISPELNDCTYRKMEASKNSLKAELTLFEKRTLSLYEADPMLGKQLIDKVRAAQKAWESFRELDCRVEAFAIEEGTSAHATTVNFCRIRMNEERIEALRKLML